MPPVSKKSTPAAKQSKAAATITDSIPTPKPAPFMQCPPKPNGPRELFTHGENSLNARLRIFVNDDPGPGGANHSYRIHVDGVRGLVTVPIDFQKGPIGEVGVNGLSNEALAAIIIDRMEGFQGGPYACERNARALVHFIAGLAFLKERTAERVARGVEGTHAV